MDDEVQAAVRAVALDANAMPRGRVALDTVRKWAEALSTIGAELWVPEPVAWEWAEHAVSMYESLASQHRSAGRRLRQAGIEIPEWIERPQPDLIDAVLTALAAVPNVRVISVEPVDAREALRDQVLLLGPAKRKNAKGDDDPGVKTGASDSAAVRALVRYAGRDPDYVVLSKDADWRTAYEANDWVVPAVYATWDEVRASLFSLVSAVGEAPAVVRFLSGQLQHDDLSLVGAVRGASALVPEWREPDAYSVFSAEVQRVNAVAGVTDVQRLTESNELLARVFLLADVDLTEQRYFPEDASWSAHSSPWTGIVLRGEIVFAIEDDVIVRAAAEPVDSLEILPPGRYDEPRDAFEATLDALRTVPGLEELDWPTAYIERQSTWTGAVANGVAVTLGLDSHPASQWTLTVSVGDTAEFVLECFYDSGALVGGGPGFYIEPPYELVLDEVGGHNAEWHLAAAVLAAAGLVPAPLSD